MTDATENNEHPLVEELHTIARHKWSKARQCTTLLGHPLVTHTAKDPGDEAECVKALRKCLQQTVSHLKQKEKKNGIRLNRSVAKASFKLLRLKKEYEDESLTALRELIAAEWKNRRHEDMSCDSFRLHFERKHVYEPFVEEFLLFASEQLKEKGIELGDENGEYLEPPARTMPERVAKGLEKLETKWHRDRLDTLAADGSFKIKDEDEMLDVLLTLNKLAERGFRAVDHTPISKWSSDNRLKKYLGRQLKRVRESEGAVTLERIRLVDDDELTNKKNRKHLAKFVKDHEDARASLLLVPIAAREDLEVNFQPHNGLLLADAEAEPIAVTGRLGERTVGRALVYTRKGNEMRELLSEYESLKSAVEENDYDSELRKQLAESD